MTAATRKRWIDDWDPENDKFWDDKGAKIAKKNLALSMFGEHLGFGIWVVWTVVVLNLGNAGITLSVSQQFILTLLPNLIGSLLRIPYTFAIPKFGGRLWTTISATLLLLPALLLALLVPSHWLAHQQHHTQMLILCLCAAAAGVGGGNFASSMANISYFYPDRKKGFALGLNAAGGNLGVAVCQLFIPLVVIIGTPAAAVKLAKHHVHLAYAGWVWVPFIVVAAASAWFFMDSLTSAKGDPGSYVAAAKYRHTWILSFLYIGTFGSFIGFSFAMPLVIKYSFPSFLAHHTFIATYLAGLSFVGAGLGSLSRPLGGYLSDKVGGSNVTLGAFGGMAAFTALAIAGVNQHNFGLFFTAFSFIFILSGIGNGSTYKMIASAFRPGLIDANPLHGAVSPADTKRQAAAAIGIAGAIGALGGVAVQVTIRQSSLHISQLITKAKTPAAKSAVAIAHANWSVPALVAFLGSYVVFAGVTYLVYIRRPATERAPQLASI